jgi:SNF2 family DNA or RNA helicase
MLVAIRWRVSRAARSMRHRLCLSGTPVGNNPSEIWSQLGFLMLGLLDDRRGLAKRFRTARYGQPNVEPLRDRNVATS